MNIDPITIILFLLFFVAPIVNNFLKRGQGDQGKAQRPSRPSSQPRPRDTSGGRTRADTSADTRSDTSTGNSGGFSQRLEEARRRVQEAMSEGQALSRSERDRNEDSDLFSSASQEQAQQTPRQSSQRTSTSSQGQTRQAFAGLGREGVSQRLPSQQGKQRSSQSATTDLDDAPPLRVQRLGGRRGGKMAREASRLEFDRNAVRQGVIWRELLDEPLAKRKRNQRIRRDPSQRP